MSHTLGTLSIGAQTLTVAPGAGSTSGTAGIIFGATTLTGAATFSPATGASLTLGATEVGANLLTMNGAGATTIAALNSAGAVSIAATGIGATTIATINAGAGGLIKTGTGRVMLSGASTFATGVSVNDGIVEATNNGALGTGAVVANAGGTLEINLANSLLTAASITANPGGRVGVRGLATNTPVTLAGGILGTRTNDLGVFGGPVNVTADSSAALISYNTPANNNSITIAGKLSGASALNVVGGATANAGLKALILTNSANDFSGVFNVASGQRLSSVSATTGNTLGTASVNLTGSFLRLNDNGTGADGTLAYGNNISVGAGGGTIDLDRVSGNNTGNTFALGNLALSGVTLTVNGGANGYKASFTGGTLSGNATIANSGGVTISGAVNGGFGLTKTGAGALTLGGANGYTGATTVTTGALNLTGSLAGALALGANTTLSGNGSVAGAATVGNGAVLNPGNAGSGTLTLGSLTFGSALADTATVNFTTDATAGNISVTGAGGLFANGSAGTVSLKLLSTLPSVGQHTIIDYAGAIGGPNGFAAFTLAPLPNPRIVASLQNDAGNTRIVLDVTAVDAPRWTGGVSGEWSTAALGAPKNWKLIVGVGGTDYISGDNVLFDDQATGSTALDLSIADVTPTSVTFDNSIAKSYTLAGSKAIAGATGLVKTSSGTVTIGNTNTFTGPVSISTGTVSVTALANSAAASPLGAGTSVSLAGGGTLEFTGAIGSTNRALNITAGGGTVRVSAASTLTLAGAVTATGAFTLENAGTATISGAIGGSAGAIVNGAGATTISGNVTTSLALNGSGTSTVSGSISAAGALTKAGAGTATLTGATNNPSSTTISAGILQIGDGTAAGSIGTGLITNNATLTLNTPAAGIIVGSVITGSGVLTKTGAGSATLNGAVANTFTGTTTVNGGNLILSKTSGIDAIGGNLVIEFGGTVSYGTTAGQLADHIPGTSSITINGGTFGSGAGATLAAPTTGVVDTVGSVTVNSGSFLSGRGPGATPAAFTVLGDFKQLGGSALVQRGGGLTANAVQITFPAVLDLDGGSGTPNNQSRLNVGAGGLVLGGTAINFNAGPSAVIAGSVGSILTLGGNVTSTGSGILARMNPTVSSAFVDLGAAERTFDVAGALAVEPVVRNGALLKTNAGTLTLTGANTFAGGTTITGGAVNANTDTALGAAAGPVAISGNATLRAEGAISTTARTLTLGAGGGRIDTNGNAVTLGAGSTVTGSVLTKVGTGTLTISGAQTYATLTATAGRTDLTSALGTGTSTINASAQVNSSVSQTLDALNINDGGIVTIGTLPPPSPTAPESPAEAWLAAPAELAAAAAVPEPGSAALLLGGLAMLLNARRRNR